MRSEFPIPSRLPRPVGYNLLVVPRVAPNTTASGIHLPDETIDKMQLSAVVCQVLDMGPEAYLDETKFPTGAWCKVGDYVMIDRYAGVKFLCEGKELRWLPDDKIQGIVDDPDDITARYY